MSRRITIRTEMKDLATALEALKLAHWRYFENDEGHITIGSGPMAGCSLNLKTGIVSGDEDNVSRTPESMGALKPFYAEAQAIRQVKMAGHSVVSRIVRDGKTVLRCMA